MKSPVQFDRERVGFRLFFSFKNFHKKFLRLKFCFKIKVGHQVAYLGLMENVRVSKKY